jgi:serine protease Do
MMSLPLTESGAEARSSTLTGRVRRVIGAAALCFVVLAPGMAGAQGLRKGPDSLADLAERVTDAVVNIKASQRVAQRNVPLPQLPPGSPFEDLFNDFFNRQGPNRGGPEGQPPGRAPQQGQPGQQGQPPRSSQSLGSGFVIDPTGIVITNNHVIAEATDVTVVFNDGTELKAEVVGKDPKTDLAVLRVKSDKPLKSVKFGDSEKARVGDWVMAIGNPFGFGGSVSVGIVSAKQRNIRSGPYDSFIQTDAAINRGNSGGPLFNMDGDVIGINTAIISPSGGSIGIGFAVPSSLAMPVIEQLREFGETRRGWLGVAIQDVDDDTADALKLGAKRGAMVISVDDKGPAKPAGLEREDVILRFDGKEIKNSRDLPRIVAQTPIGKAVDVVVWRKGAEVTRKVTLGRLDESPQLASANRPEAPRNAPNATVLGMELGALTAETRRRFNIKDGIEGVVVLRVDPNAQAAERRVQAGDVIVEVQREAVKTVAELRSRVEALKSQGQRRALFYVATGAEGTLRYVTLPLE